MGKISRIQLRGISRTPSDRMSEDGGLSESLNMYLDTAEQAPAFVPDDVTEELGLPADLEAERIFIHKTANYENYIVVQGDRVVAYTPSIEDKEPLLVLSLDKVEKVNDITSVGNTLIVATSRKMAYILWKNATYSYLGSEIPRPAIEFRTISNLNPEEYQIQNTLQHATVYNPILGFVESAWSEAIADIKAEIVNENTIVLQGLNDSLWENINVRIRDLLSEGKFAAPFFVRFAVRLYDLSYYHISEPILIGAGYDKFVDIKAEKSRSTNNGISTYYRWRLENVFTSIAHLVKWDIGNWGDIVSSIDLFFSTPLYFPVNGAPFTKLVKTGTTGDGDLVESDYYEFRFQQSDPNDMRAIENEILGKSLFYKVKSFNLGQLEGLFSGYDLAEASGQLIGENLAERELLSDSAFSKQIIASLLSTYNQRLIAKAESQSYAESFNVLPSTNIAIGNTDVGVGSVALFFVFYLEDGTKIVAKDYRGYVDFYSYSEDINVDDPSKPNVKSADMFGLIFFPETSCNKVTICTEEGDAYTFEMKRHPMLPYSYAFWGLSKTLSSFSSEKVNITELLSDQNKTKQTNKLFISEPSNPFVFPLKGTFEFQSNVIGVAIATTALSQGQFGQFPLYVFTEDGIWAMETAADGSFVSQKPLSREVCINPDSICSIDNAVVYVTDKAVMMIQGSQVMNISPYMNGRHYTPNDSALNLIRSQEGFDTLIDPISDDDPFMSFMKDAKVAYDYTGQRLVFISPSNNGFQYVYKIDTQTWHKVAFSELDLIAPLNSYPACLVQGKIEDYSKLYWIINPVPSPSASLISDVMQDFSLETNIHLSEGEVRSYLRGGIGIDVSIVNEENISTLSAFLALKGCEGQVRIRTYLTKIYSLSTVLDAKPDPENPQNAAKGILITRPFDLGEPDVFKTITDVRIRGQFPKGAVKFILQASNDWVNWVTISTLRGRAWKLFRIFVLADLDPTDRISWIDVQYETKFTNKLR